MKSRVVKLTFRKFPKGEQFNISGERKGFEINEKIAPCVLVPEGKEVKVVTKLKSGHNLVVGYLSQRDPNKKLIQGITQANLIITSYNRVDVKDSYHVEF